MKEAIYSLALAIVATGCSVQSENVLLRNWETPFQTPPFDEIKSEHFMPAFLEAMQAEKAEVEAITNDREEPTFENTIEALEEGGELLDRVGRVFSCLNGVDGKVTIRVLIDRPMMEIIGNHGRVFITGPREKKGEVKTVEAFAVGGTAKLVKVEANELESIWKK